MRLYGMFGNFRGHIYEYPTPISLTYAWGFGSILGLCLVVQIISGVSLAMHYTPHVDLAYYSVEHIVRDVQYGWLLRYVHANGASMYFIFSYIHLVRGMYYKSYRNPTLWLLGVTIWLLSMATAFMGYVLPWGQMSFWGTTVITNLASVLPVCGNNVATWLWGGFSVGNPALNRFFAVHFLLPFVVGSIVVAHICVLHSTGSSTVFGAYVPTDSIHFTPYFGLKDICGISFFFSFFVCVIAFSPDVFGHPDNYVMANPLVTPTHIVPEWYFVPFYTILRSIPDKAGGVFAFALSVAIFYILPLHTSHTMYLKTTRHDTFSQYITWFFICVVLGLGYIGTQVAEYPNVISGQIFTILYFLYFLLLTNMTFFEHELLIIMFYMRAVCYFTHWHTTEIYC